MPAIDTYAVTTRTATAFRDLNKFGNHLADYVSISADKTYSGFGNGTGYTVSSWISDGAFADLAAVQAVYPICQGTSDTVDWVLLQTAIDDTIYSNLGSSNYGLTKSKLIIPAGKYICNRPLHVGYRRAGTPPSSLNGNGYVTITIEGEGLQVDASGNGMTGVTIEFTSQCGFIAHGYQHVRIVGLSIRGPWLSWNVTNMGNILNSDDAWDLDAWRPTGIADENWVGGTAVSTGIGLDLYTSNVVTYPDVPLPESFGGGTVAAGFTGTGGTHFHLDYVYISGFIVGYGRPHGDNNGEFFTYKHGTISACTIPLNIGHSQGRNHSFENLDLFYFYTAISNKGGTRGNANWHGSYLNIHAAYGYQWFYHDNADWSGAVTLRSWYGEGIYRIGTFTGGTIKLDNCYFSCFEGDAQNGVAPDHFSAATLVLDNTTITGLRHGLVGSAYALGGNRVIVGNGTLIGAGSNKNYANHANVTQIDVGMRYLNGILNYGGMNHRIVNDNTGFGRFGLAGDHYSNFYGYGDQTWFDQEFVDFSAVYPGQANGTGGSAQMQGSIHRLPVPKIATYQLNVSVSSRSGYDLTCGRTSVGDIKADVGDVFGFEGIGADDGLRTDTWFVVVSVNETEMILRQLNNYAGDTQYDYRTNGRNQVTATNFLTYYICTRVKQHRTLWVGDITNGSNVITNVKNAFKYGSGDDFDSDHFVAAVGDFHLHQEIERGNTGGSGLKVPNAITDIDFTANTITLTSNFNITRTNYPIVFYVDVHNA